MMQIRYIVRALYFNKLYILKKNFKSTKFKIKGQSAQIYNREEEKDSNKFNFFLLLFKKTIFTLFVDHYLFH